MMNCDRGFLLSFGGWTVPVCLLRMRGELAIGAHLRATDLYTVGSFDPDHDAACASAAKLRAAGPFSRSASSARFEYGIAPPRIGQFGSRAEKASARRNGAECDAR